MKLKTNFQDEDFKLGEVADVNIATMPDGRIKAQAVAKSGRVHTSFYDDLKTFANDWEDYEEKGWYLDSLGEPVKIKFGRDDFMQTIEAIGNCFETEEEAEKAVEKLKAWKRLEDHNLRVERGQRTFVNADNKLTSQKPLFIVDTYEEVEDDLDLLFGGEE